MNAKSRTWVYTLGFIACFLLGYFLTYIWFLRAHQTTGVLGPPGQGLTTMYLAIPDTKINRVLYAFYSPLDRLLCPKGQIVWEKPVQLLKPSAELD